MNPEERNYGRHRELAEYGTRNQANNPIRKAVHSIPRLLICGVNQRLRTNWNVLTSATFLIIATHFLAIAAQAEESTAITNLLEGIRTKHKFPALAAAVVVDGKIVQQGAVGFRKHGSPEKATTDDKFHIGSITKSMTATLAGILVDQGKIQWTTTIAEQFPELKEQIHPSYKDATLEHLLSHRSGAPTTPLAATWAAAWNAKGSPAEQRLSFVKAILANPPESKPGAVPRYSNAGYAIAGVMLERAAGKSWEELMQQLVFDPLKMSSAGFGAPATVGKVDQPWGHRSGLLATIAVPPGPKADNPLAISPAGAVHCSIEDLARYAAVHLQGGSGGGTLLKPETFRKLHTPIKKEGYSPGWIVMKRKWADGNALMHSGSNTMFYAVVWIAPKRNLAVVVATNVGSDHAFPGCDEAASELIQQFAPSK